MSKPVEGTGIVGERLGDDGIMAALSKYVEFEGSLEGGRSGTPAQSSTALGQWDAQQDSSAPALRKGLTVIQVEQILGPATKVSQRNEGSIEMTIRDYTGDGQQVTTQFVGGVLIDYKITPR